MPDAVVSTQDVNLTPYNPDMVQVFKNQLNTYKDQLLDLYQQRSQLIADRELARFKYLVTWRFKLSSALGWLAKNINPSLAPQVSAFSSALNKQIPMSDMSGASISGYMIPPSVVGAESTKYLFSPVSVFLEDKFTSAIQQAAPYIGKTFFQNNKSLLSNIPVADAFQMWPTAAGRLTARDSNSGVYQQFSVPVNTAFIKAQFGVDDAGAQSVSALLSQDTGFGSFNQIMSEGFDDYKDLLTQTQAIFNFQPRIDAVEDQISMFLAQYKAYGLIDQSLSLSDVLKELQSLADTQNAQAVLQAVQNTLPVAVEIQKKVNWVPYALVLAALIALKGRKRNA